MRRLPYLVLLLVIVVAFVVAASEQLRPKELADTDAYLRLVRAEQLATRGGWYDGRIERSNAPYGTAMHWTRPFDVILLGGGAMLALFAYSFHSALYWAGFLVSPFFFLLAAVALVWATKPIVPPRVRFLVPLALLVQPQVFPYCSLGRADHHALVLLLFVLAFGWTLRAVAAPARRQPGVLAGAALGVALWISPEILPAIAAFTAGALVHWWFTFDAPWRQAHAQARLAGALAVTLAIALPLERPPGELLAIEFDRLSVVHLALALMLAGYWSLLRLAPAPRVPRLGLALGAAAAALGLFALAFPAFFARPFHSLDARSVDLWIRHVSELQPALPTTLRRTGIFLGHVGPALVALPWLARRRHSESHRFLLVVLAVLLPFGIVHMRALVHPQALLAVCLVAVTDSVFTRLQHRLRGIALTVAQAGAAVTVILGFLVAGLALSLLAVSVRPQPATPRVPLKALAEHLDRPDGLGDRSRVIVAFVDFGAELLYRTRHGLVATPYHRNAEGFLDVYDLMTAKDDAQARAILDPRGVDLVLLAPAVDARLFDKRAPEGATLYRRLRAGEEVPGLRPVPLPPELAHDFLLFEVSR